MSIRNLDALFAPRSVAVVGASERAGSVGNVVMRQLLAGGFDGPILPVNPHRRAVAGVLCYPDIGSLPITPELAIVCTPPTVVPETVAELGSRGTRAAIVVTAGLSQAKQSSGKTLRQAMLEAARPHLLRILGPNTVGLLVPRLGLNASFAHVGAKPGKLALIAQSGAVCTIMLDWAAARGIGFSYFISLGDSADVDFGDAIDFLASDPDTRAILLYIEAITDARKFMSAARAASRNKPVIAIKAGRVAEGAKAAASHTGALAGADDVYDAALRRAGILRVNEIGELFDATETLAFTRSIGEGRLAIVTNGGGPGVLAVDSFVAQGGKLAALSDDTLAKLDHVLPKIWSRSNPVDIIGDAPATRYREALSIVLDDPGVDAALVMHAPTAVADANEAARVVAEVAANTKKEVLTSWLGETAVAEPRRMFSAAGIATYETPEQAVRGALHIVRFNANQAQLLQTPTGVAINAPDHDAVRSIIREALTSGASMLSEHDAKRLIAAIGIPVATTEVVADAEAAIHAAQQIGFPVALKVFSPDITHKSEVGGIALDLVDEGAVRSACARITDNVRAARPGARLSGFTIQKMVRRHHARELIVGASVDATFGPTILFGEGGTAVETINDKAIGLPPLNQPLARAMIERTRIVHRLASYRDVPAVNFAAIEETLVRVSQLVAEHGEIVELDINPLLADAEGVIALDARVRIAPYQGEPARRLSIRPYPRALEEIWRARDGAAVPLRPIRPEDEPAHRQFLSNLDPGQIEFKFFGMARDWSHSELARFTQIDYDREMAFVALEDSNKERGGRFLAVVRGLADPDNECFDFSLMVATDKRDSGLDQVLMEKLIRYLRARGTRSLIGTVRADDARFLALAGALGFSVEPVADTSECRVTLLLASARDSNSIGDAYAM